MTGFDYLHGNIRSRTYDDIGMRNIFNAEIGKTLLTYIRVLSKREELFDLYCKRYVIKKSDR